MLVKELIQELQKFNPEDEMLFTCGIESGRSFDSCSNGDWGIDVEDLDEDEIKEMFMKECGHDDCDYDELLEDDKEVVDDCIEGYKPRVVFNISGECTDYE